MNESQNKRKMHRLLEIAYASKYKNLSITPNEVERQILLRSRSQMSKERFAKMLCRFIEGERPIDETVSITLHIHEK